MRWIGANYLDSSAVTSTNSGNIKNGIRAALGLFVILLGIWSIIEVARGTEAKAFEGTLFANSPRFLTRMLSLCGGLLFIVIGSIELRRTLKRLRSKGHDRQ